MVANANAARRMKRRKGADGTVAVGADFMIRAHPGKGELKGS